MEELKACPFCGGEAEADAGGCAEYYGHEHQDCWVSCKDCGATVAVDTGGRKDSDFPCSCCHDTWATVHAKWNKRA